MAYLFSSFRALVAAGLHPSTMQNSHVKECENTSVMDVIGLHQVWAYFCPYKSHSNREIALFGIKIFRSIEQWIWE
jgi:hypothetical protein